MEVRSVSGPGNAPNVAALDSVSVARASGPRERSEALDTKAVAVAASLERVGEKREETKVVSKPAVQQTGTRLHVDKASKRIVAQIVNQQNEVVKQIPPQDMLKIAANFAELQGRLFDEKA